MISERLKMIANMVSKGLIVADIGSDHALLPCYLILNQISHKTYAIDNKKGPLQRAKLNIEKYELQDKVFEILDDGLNNLPRDVQSVVIAGMGEKTIETILLNDLARAKGLDEIIFQSNTDWPEFRMFLKKHGFSIIDEKFLSLNKQDNLFVKARYTEISNIENIVVGDLLIMDDAYLNYLENELQKYEDILQFNPKLKFKIDVIKNVLNK
ncbi:MAG: SAM-dependent methyltransferase [Erysipelothrix sp.]|nr:SAM-dependent methyltransferase [Erysipelothrix sp.]